MSYATQSDIENVFGKDNVAKWSNLEGESDIDTIRIAAALAYAAEDIENRFRNGKYAIPFSPVPVVIKHWVSTLAGLWLFESRPDYKNAREEQIAGFKDMRDNLDIEIEAYVSGQRQLTANKRRGSQQPSAPTVIT